VTLNRKCVILVVCTCAVDKKWDGRILVYLIAKEQKFCTSALKNVTSAFMVGCRC